MTTAKLTPRGQITIPFQIRKDLKLTSRAVFKITRRGEKIVLDPIELGQKKAKKTYSDAEIQQFLKDDHLSPVELKKIRGLWK